MVLLIITQSGKSPITKQRNASFYRKKYVFKNIFCYINITYHEIEIVLLNLNKPLRSLSKFIVFLKRSILCIKCQTLLFIIYKHHITINQMMLQISRNELKVLNINFYIFSDVRSLFYGNMNRIFLKIFHRRMNFSLTASKFRYCMTRTNFISSVIVSYEINFTF